MRIKFFMTSAWAMSLSMALALPLSGGLSAQEGLRPVGSVTYDPLPSEPETGTFNLRPEDRRLRAFRIQAARGEAEIRSVTIVYGDGERQRVRVAQDLAEGQRTALLRLERPRPVRAVDVVYVPTGAVRLVMLADSGPPPPPPAKWVDLGCKSVGFIADRDRLTVNSSERFRALRLRSIGFDIEMVEMLVRYANGSRDNFVIRQVIPSGSVTRPIDLRGERRRIGQIEFLYRTNAISTVKTKLCVEGLSAVDPDSEEFLDDTEPE